jgi:hypothetical protein
MQGANSIPLQTTVSQNFPNVVIRSGDCIIHIVQSDQNGGVDAEAQVSALVVQHISPPPNPAPYGSFDSASCDIATGWACDDSDDTESITVRMTDAPIGSGHIIGDVVANSSRGGSGNLHRALSGISA